MYCSLTVAMYTAVEMVVNTVRTSFILIVSRNLGNQLAACRSPVVDDEVPVAECRHA